VLEGQVAAGERADVTEAREHDRAAVAAGRCCRGGVLALVLADDDQHRRDDLREQRPRAEAGEAVELARDDLRVGLVGELPCEPRRDGLVAEDRADPVLAYCARRRAPLVRIVVGPVDAARRDERRDPVRLPVGQLVADARAVRVAPEREAIEVERVGQGEDIARVRGDGVTARIGRRLAAPVPAVIE
jgi:hypothetical protein